MTSVDLQGRKDLLELSAQDRTRPLRMRLKRTQDNDDGNGFTFIHLSRPGDHRQNATRKAIRHHVMAREGRSRRKRPKTLTFSIEIPSPAPFSTNDGAISMIHPYDELQSGDQVPRSLHPHAFFPVETDSRARQLIQFSTIMVSKS